MKLSTMHGKIDTDETEMDLKNLLDTQTKEGLIELILSMGLEFPLVEQRIRLHLTRPSVDDEVEECRQYIRSYANEFADRHGFVSYRYSSQAVDGGFHVLERAEQALADGKYVRAMELSMCVLEEMLDLMQRADDSGGFIGGAIDEAIERMDSISDAVMLTTESTVDSVFQLLLQESEIPKLDGWTDWRLGIIESAAKLTTDPQRMNQWEEHVTRVGLCTSRTDESSHRDYFQEKIIKMRYELIRREGDEKAAEYLQKHLDIPDMRTLAIRAAMQNKQYDVAIRLAKEGEEWALGSGYRGLVTVWKQCRFNAYGCTGDLQNQRDLGRELVLNGDYEYYAQLKKLYDVSEWGAVYESLVSRFEELGASWGVYPQILIEEKDTHRLLAYVSRQPSLIEQYYRYLIPEHQAEVVELFLKHIRESARRASNRSAYRGVCAVIRMLRKAGGKLEADEVVQELLQTYPRRPAFRDELLSL